MTGITFGRVTRSKKGRSSVFVKYGKRKIGEIFRLTPYGDWYVYFTPDLVRQYSVHSLSSIRKLILEWEQEIVDAWIRAGSPGFKQKERKND